MTKWTPIEQGNPDEEGTYLVAFSDGAIETFPYENQDDWTEFKMGGITITHWRELPEGPTKEPT